MSDILVEEGTVQEVLSKAMYLVQLKDGTLTTATVGGKLRMQYVKFLAGDTVRVEVRPQDKSRGRIIKRVDD